MNIGFYLPNINQQIEEHRYIVENINKLCELRPYDHIVIFNNYFQLMDSNKKYYILSANHAKYFRGILFLFDTQSAFLTQTFPGPDKQILYMQTPEWAERSNVPYMMWHNIYLNNKFETLAGNDDVAKLLDICWKPPLAKIDKFNYKEVNNVIQRI
jgi:hypothetical protein